MPKNCPRLLANGTCTIVGCSFNHVILLCETCGMIASDTNSYNAHMRSRKHLKKVAGTVFYCAVCEVNIRGGMSGWTEHMSNPKHRGVAEAKGISGSVEPQAPVPLHYEMQCDLCSCFMPSHSWASHISGARHRKQMAFASYRTALDEAERDKNGISVDGKVDFDILEPSSARSGVESVLKIKMTLPLAKLKLVKVHLALKPGKKSVSAFSIVNAVSDHRLTSVRPLDITIRFCQTHIGRYEDRLEFIFEDAQLKKQFIISRTLKAIVGSKADHEALKAKLPYVPRRRTTRQTETNVVEGERPPSLKAIPYVGKLPKSSIPTQLSLILSGTSSISQQIGNIKKIFMPQTLDSERYGRHFKYLLWIEEFKMESDLERYDIENAKLTKHNSYYYLDVPGLAEKRPSVLVGDEILVQPHGAVQGHWYSGGVHIVRQVEVGLRFHGSFKWSESQRYNVRFKLNRIPLRRQHQAMDTVFTQSRVLFPEGGHLSSSPYPRAKDIPIKPFNILLATNPPQLQAVASIVERQPGSVPFVVFGPPGTGKTITIVEAIRQILTAHPRAKVLATAPSNSAADLIASRLSEGGLGTDDLFRFYAPSRFKNQVPDKLLSYTYIRDDGHFSVPPMARMKAFKVVVTTCVSASVISGIGMARGHYSHIFIDEAGQATEPEAFISIKTMADNDTNIVLSGDPKQLGPIIRSTIARELGLELSYLERLMNRDPYDVQRGYGKSVVKLVKNFRSHSAILKFPNERFYNSDLEPCADRKVINSYLNSSYLPSKQFPIVFHAVSGKDDREASSPSFFNIDEIIQVKDYVQKLKEDRKFRTTDSDIGIIAPYHAQCLKIRASLRSVADGVKVGSVEEFQGQERRVIIISTVRSSKEFVEYDLRHTLGFVANPRRFNVAVTRAQALLIVVGDPQVLSLDPLWRSFLNYIHINGGWTGPPISWDPQTPVDDGGGYDRAVREAAQIDMNDFTRKMEELTMAGVDEVDATVDLPWRDTE